ncbi:MAG: sulfurtransferase [Acidobacteriota bacterium]
MKLVRSWVLPAVAGWLLVAQPVVAAEGISGNLVTAKWLEQNLNRSEVVLLDASSPQVYAAKHIPGAISVDFLIYGFPERTLADMEARYQSWGISPGKKIVMYDQGGTFLATRLMFSLYYHGFPVQDLLVLDGGLAKWEALGLPITKDVPPAPGKGSFKIVKLRKDARVAVPEVLTATGDPANNVLLEALGPDWHFGQVAPFNREGHIPNSTLLPADDFFNADKTFKSAEEIRRMVTYVGIRPEQQIHSYCGGGVAASVPYFALKFILNFPKVALFPESEVGWLSDPRDLPYWTYDAPFLLRDTRWMQSWGGQMMRMYGVSKVSVVDVRPGESFGQGHIPFALNVPGDVFRRHVGSPEKLAPILGPAGVDATQEAVIVSGGGLTRDAALAFVMLEKLGQKKVSIFVDSADEWNRVGFKLTKDATIIGPRKGPMDLSIQPTIYPGSLRPDVMIADPTTTKGVYPKVFIASGTSEPDKTPAGTVVHVPYSDLLNADGTPKPAKEIWKILAKAGVPRYAELVCFCDDPGEAAVNFFLLKLMGYPDVKVWADAAPARSTF